MKKALFFTLLLLPSFHLKTLYHTLEPTSLLQNLTFYELYPDTEEGKEALRRVKALLKTTQDLSLLCAPLLEMKAGSLTEEEIVLIEHLGASFANRRLPGYQIESEKELLQLSPEEIDLGKALVLSQAGEGSLFLARSYSALLDLMALQIQLRLPSERKPEAIIYAMNQFIFEEMHFRFPPKSLYAKDVDLFTFLPSVMDNHLGVCLGVTSLYLAIAQRLDLPLEIITPPGHIFIRYHEGEKLINIETTARGVHMPSEKYLGVNTRKLQMRTMKEVVGLAHVNEASTYLQRGKFEKASKCYEKAIPYLSHDPFIQELLALSYVLGGEKKKGCELLAKVQDVLPDYAVFGRTLAKDYLEGRVDEEGLAVIFREVDHTRDSIYKKQEKLLEVLTKYPDFLEGLEQLAISWIQLHRHGEAIDVLTRYHALCPEDPTINYYLSVLHGERHDFASCWKHLLEAEKITLSREFYPKALKELRLELTTLSPP